MSLLKRQLQLFDNVNNMLPKKILLMGNLKNV